MLYLKLCRIIATPSKGC